MDAFEIDEVVMIADLSVCGGIAGKWVPLRWIIW